MAEGAVKRKKAFPKGVVEPASLGENRIWRTSGTVKKEKSPPAHFKADGDRNNKGAGFSTRDVTVLFQVVHEMLRRVGPHRHPMQFPVPPGEIYHVLLSVHSLSNQLPSRRTRTNSEGSEATILPPSAKIYICLFMPIVFSFLIYNIVSVHCQGRGCPEVRWLRVPVPLWQR